MKKGLFGLIFVLCFAMPAYSQHLSKSNYSDKAFETLKNKLVDELKEGCLEPDPEDLDDAESRKEMEVYCSCVADAARKTLTRTEVEKLITVSLTFDEEKMDAVYEEVLGGEVDTCNE